MGSPGKQSEQGKKKGDNGTKQNRSDISMVERENTMGKKSRPL